MPLQRLHRCLLHVRHHIAFRFPEAVKKRLEDSVSMGRLNMFRPFVSRLYQSAVLLRILDLIHEALVSETVISKRSLNDRYLHEERLNHSRYIYYKDVALFQSQSVVDRYGDILANTIGVSRSALNVVCNRPVWALAEC